MVEYVSKKNKERTSFYKIYNKTGGASVRISKAEFLKKGGSVDIVKQWSGPDDSAPEPLLNGGLYTGESFKGPWGNYPVPPTTNGFMANLASANPPPGALDQFPGYVRLGNNFQVNPSKDFSNETMIKCTGGAKKSKSKKPTKSNKKGGFLNYLLGSGDEQVITTQTGQVPQAQVVVPQSQVVPQAPTVSQAQVVVPQAQVVVPQAQVVVPQAQVVSQEQVVVPQAQVASQAQVVVPQAQVVVPQAQVASQAQVVQNSKNNSQIKKNVQEQQNTSQAGGKSKKKSSKPSKKPVNKYKSASYL